MNSTGVVSAEVRSSRGVSRPGESWRIFCIATFGIFAPFLDATILFVAFPSIRRSFPSVSAAELSWVINAYSIVFGAVLLTSGRLADQYGRRKLFLLGAIVFTAASILCGVAPSPAALIVSRLLQAVGGAILLPSSLALLLEEFPKSKWAVVVTLWGAAGALAAAIGPTVGAVVIQKLGWPGAFFLNVPAGVAAWFFGARLLRDSRDTSARGVPDLIGIALSISGVALVTFGIVEIPILGWRHSRVVASVLIGLALFAAFLWRCAKHSAPVLDLSLFRNSNCRFANSATLVFTFAFNAMYLCNVLFLTSVWHYSTLQVGLAITPAPLLVMPVAAIAGRLAAKAGHRPFIVTGAIVFAAASLWQCLRLTDTPRYADQWLPAAILTGIGVGLSISTLASAAVHDLPPARYAVGSAVQAAVRQLGAVLGVAAALSLLGQSAGTVTLSAYKTVFGFVVAGGILTAALAAGIRTRPSV